MAILERRRSTGGGAGGSTSCWCINARAECILASPQPRTKQLDRHRVQVPADVVEEVHGCIFLSATCTSKWRM
jgi:hypothetical protein